jgi:hypothetical protein
MKPDSEYLSSIEQKVQILSKKMVAMHRENASLTEEIKKLKAQIHSAEMVNDQAKPSANVPKTEEVEKNQEMSTALMQKLKKDFLKYITEIDQCMDHPINRS